MRYLVFAGPRYYPDGGANDLVSIAVNLSEAKVAAENEVSDHAGNNYWANIYCTVDNRVVSQNDFDGDGWYDPDSPPEPVRQTLVYEKESSYRPEPWGDY